MFIYADEDGVKGNKDLLVSIIEMLFQQNRTTIATWFSSMPIHYVNRAKGDEQYLEGEVLHFSKYSPSRLYGFSPVITFTIIL